YYFVLTLLLIFAFIFGAVIASFLNVVIYRLPLNIPIVKGRSFCPNCNHQIADYDLIPIISFVFLGGKCRNCKTKISIRYPLVETLGGMLLVLAFIKFGYSVNALFVFAFCVIIMTIAFIDYDTQTIPNVLIVFLAIISFVMAFFIKDIGILQRVIGFFTISLPMLLMSIVIPDSFGGGDIKLLAVAGFALGWANILLSFFIALMVSGVYLLYLKAKKLFSKKEHIPFGPQLGIGIIIAFLYGENIITWYLGLFNIF
ncbi:MAG: prepilin peptidase, partial [Oscillospiraceae bacterium]